MNWELLLQRPSRIPPGPKRRALLLLVALSLILMIAGLFLGNAQGFGIKAFFVGLALVAVSFITLLVSVLWVSGIRARNDVASNDSDKTTESSVACD